MDAPPAATAVDNGMVLIAITLIVLPIAAISFARSGQAWRGIGRGPYAIDPDLPPRSPSAPRANQVFDPFAGELDSHGQGDSQATREAEVRQMVEARAYVRSRRGAEPLDVDSEVKRRLADLVGLDD
jgi:hypothetical protein